MYVLLRKGEIGLEAKEANGLFLNVFDGVLICRIQDADGGTLGNEKDGV